MRLLFVHIQILPAERLHQPVLSSMDRGFLYGDGCFSTLRVVAGQVQLWLQHQQRLAHSTQRLALRVDMATLTQAVQQAAAHLGSGTLKIVVSRGVGARGYLPPQQAATVYIQAFAGDWADLRLLPKAAPIHSGILQGQLAWLPPSLLGLKTLNRLEQVLLRQELAAQPWAEALVTDVTGRVVEGVQSNCFWHTAQGWCTPSLQRAGIAGVMRAEILARMQQLGVSCQLVDVPASALANIDALFFCNALTGIVPVAGWQGRQLHQQPIEQLHAMLCALDDRPHLL